MMALYLSSGLIFVRSIFRLIEYSQGSDGMSCLSEQCFFFDAIFATFANVLLMLRVQTIVSKGVD